MGGAIGQRGEEPAKRFARLEREIATARQKLAALRHDGERHFIGDRPVHADVPGVLKDIVDEGDELSALREMSGGSGAVNRAFTREEVDDQHRALDHLEDRIQRLSTLLDDDPHARGRHFIDG